MSSFTESKKIVSEPLFHIIKRNDISLKKAILIRTLAILAGFICCALFCTIFFEADPISVIIEIFRGNFFINNSIWELLRDTALLLGVGLALIPAFKMKFWNLGGNGQIIMGSLSAVACMILFGGKLPDIVVNLMMIVSSIIVGAVWALIPSIFKAFFKTNETLFTLMMNYIALGIVNIFIFIWDRTGSHSIGIIKEAQLPVIFNDSGLTILVVAILTAFMFVYLKYSKHGYELSVVGESENTARYIGLDIKKIIMRTMVLSGAICGIIGLLIAGSISHTISTSSANNLGFTAIIVAWLAKFDPLMMVLASFFISFITKGMGQVQTAFCISNNAVSDITVAIIYFFVIACEFFISYKIIFKKHKKTKEDLIISEQDKVVNLNEDKCDNVETKNLDNVEVGDNKHEDSNQTNKNGEVESK